MKKQIQKGFTLPEILVVLVLITIVSSLTLGISMYINDITTSQMEESKSIYKMGILKEYILNLENPKEEDFKIENDKVYYQENIIVDNIAIDSEGIKFSIETENNVTITYCVITSSEYNIELKFIITIND